MTTPFEPLGVRAVINAAGKLTALGGSAQSAAVAKAQADAAGSHVDVAELRAAAGRRIAALTGAEAACVTSGAAAGIVIGVAALITGEDEDAVATLPDSDGRANRIVLSRGHDVNFGAPVTQMIRLGGGRPVIAGTEAGVTEADLEAALADSPDAAGFLYVQSHHARDCARVPLPRCIALARAHALPVLVDAAAEGDLRRYIDLGADLVTYSGGKAIAGPTVGFIAGRAALIRACELQQAGIARAMKVGKEQIAGLMAALSLHGAPRPDDAAIVAQLIDDLCGLPIRAYAKPDEAGRPITRVAVESAGGGVDLLALVRYLAEGDPSIRTRNHQLPDGRFLIDPRELTRESAATVAARIRAYFAR